MQNIKLILAIILMAAIVAVSSTSRADDSTNGPAKPYPLDTCLVCGMKLGSMGEPYVFVYKGQGDQGLRPVRESGLRQKS